MTWTTLFHFLLFQPSGARKLKITEILLKRGKSQSKQSNKKRWLIVLRQRLLNVEGHLHAHW